MVLEEENVKLKAEHFMLSLHVEVLGAGATEGRGHPGGGASGP